NDVAVIESPPQMAITRTRWWQRGPSSFSLAAAALFVLGGTVTLLTLTARAPMPAMQPAGTPVAGIVAAPPAARRASPEARFGVPSPATTAPQAAAEGVDNYSYYYQNKVQLADGSVRAPKDKLATDFQSLSAANKTAETARGSATLALAYDRSSLAAQAA